MADTLKKMKIIIVVLAVLLGLSLTALVGVIIYGQLDPSNGSAVIPDNYIEPQGGELNTGAKVTQLRTGPVLLCASIPTVNLSGNVPVMALSKTVITSDSAKETIKHLICIGMTLVDIVTTVSAKKIVHNYLEGKVTFRNSHFIIIECSICTHTTSATNEDLTLIL